MVTYQMSLEWDFELKRWEAVFLAGHAQGDVLHFGVSQVTPALVKQLRKMDLANIWYSRSAVSNMKGAAKVYIILWCKAIVEQKLAHGREVFFLCPVQDIPQEGFCAKPFLLVYIEQIARVQVWIGAPLEQARQSYWAAADRPEARE